MLIYYLPPQKENWLKYPALKFLLCGYFIDSQSTNPNFDIMSDIRLHHTYNRLIKLETRLENQMVCLTRDHINELFSK